MAPEEETDQRFDLVFHLSIYLFIVNKTDKQQKDASLRVSTREEMKYT